MNRITKGPLYRFRSRALAQSFRACAVCPLWLVLGDHAGDEGEYWLVTPADAARLERAGYALAA
jgi:hypothetical protein